MYWELSRQVFIAGFFKNRSRLIFTPTMIKPGLLHIVDAQDTRTTLFSAHYHFKHLVIDHQMTQVNANIRHTKPTMVRHVCQLSQK